MKLPKLLVCEEGVTRGGEYVQCERPAIGHRIDPEDRSFTYPVCVGHVRHPMAQIKEW